MTASSRSICAGPDISSRRPCSTIPSSPASVPEGRGLTTMKRVSGATVLHINNAIKPALLLAAAASLLTGADPTFLHRYVPGVQPRPDDLTVNSHGASY